MAARAFNNEISVAQPGLFELFLKGVGNTINNITLDYGLGFNPTVVRTGPGAYTITLTDTWNACMGAWFNVVDTGTIDDWEVIIDTDLASKTIAIQVFQGGLAADLPTTATLVGRVVLLNSTAKPVKGA